MTLISTYIESPNQIDLIHRFNIDQLIVDLPFCSIRAHAPFDWSNDELLQLSAMSSSLMLNLDGIYSDDELKIIKDTIHQRSLAEIFDGFRIQDIGLIEWVKTNFPNRLIHLNPEMGFQNSAAINTGFHHGLSSFTFNHETPIDVIRSVTMPPSEKRSFEIFVQGPILIQYSRRRFLNNIYNDIFLI